jgi:hypothetical protein
MTLSAPISLPRLIVCALFMTGMTCLAEARDTRPANQTNGIFAHSLSDGGRLIIRRSPVLGYNVAISLYIDGQVAGTLVRARVFDEYITPGRHTIVAVPGGIPGGPGDRFVAKLDVRTGQTFTYIASYNVNRLLLTWVTND